LSVDLAPDVWTEIQRQLSTGSFDSPNEVLREALKALRSREPEVAAIQERIDDMEAGRVTTLDEFDREFRHRKGFPRQSIVPTVRSSIGGFSSNSIHDGDWGGLPQ
jgi:Arc/MetJ-type ribon-helix-helix transcriptional regulator